ncbi:MAG: hypothetical protein JWM05_1143, partial [Acidimicrobiales bacterium]|nr:hypothetical protein [Acidimicrobiales bacterium]
MGAVPPGRRAPQPTDRRQQWIAGIVLAVALLGAGILTAVATRNSGPRRDTQGQLQEQGGAKPHIIPTPNSGHAPTGPGDRGGWEQLLTLGLIVGGLALLGLLAWRGSRHARAGRQAWLAAARG